MIRGAYLKESWMNRVLIWIHERLSRAGQWFIDHCVSYPCHKCKYQGTHICLENLTVAGFCMYSPHKVDKDEPGT